MKYYLAPMEGITEYIYRNSYEKFFGNVDKYFTPFIVPNESRSLKTKELVDVLPENNKGMNIVPQILTNDAEGFINTSRKLQQLGYSEVNLNLGCPAKTVVSKNRGSGFLAKREELDSFLDEIFKIDDMKISIKTRIGKDNPEEFYELIKIYNKYPLEELIIHPRTQKDFYGNKPNLCVFRDALSLSNNPVCYNGDIFTINDYNKLVADFPEVNTVMLGRGILSNPGLINVIKNNINTSKNILKDFHDEILNRYIDVFPEDIYAINRMKELFGYMIYIFSDNKEYAKKIRSAQKLSDYTEAVQSLFTEQEIIKEAGLFYNKQ
ncbi:tRNA dihydrouridine synthase [Clostridium beijerinckii]|jgi:tRNA-dihydrouridine synthase|uniref:tRNA-dihydrouridine synthase n=1 Tax=Clostridium beijerinckii TaxID=1520 RepID=A0AAW3WD14_CLOBE|nr:tRNA-dihydrouridine synthase family protein [Clostridium beijerinckii]MBC2459125.1 tRNA-dihydrouridine synthase family protein [Clostridium beijerinckii]MBC2476626.1 tRNA-dihydrouridine synthase family protein [Clostridium beijerinckii]MCI1578770.1 tRNA-dihydrouridine synthase family protein [Clostridium beijerinckii]MCI1581976.1 tRNA-dihydrouridine synthase family protein [Clostridium beijerinckii]MCI1621779.1 tRNA-dihydrouridine synthase family protein [Clostridium beijerinckii]